MAKSKKPLSLVIRILNDNSYKQEVQLLVSTFKRWKIRFRNAAFTGLLKQLVTKINNFHKQFAEPICTGYTKFSATGSTRSLDDILNKTLHLFCQVQQQFSVGHLVHHLFVMQSCLARLRTFYKAILVYLVEHIEATGQLKSRLRSRCKLTLQNNNITWSSSDT